MKSYEKGLVNSHGSRIGILLSRRGIFGDGWVASLEESGLFFD